MKRALPLIILMLITVQWTQDCMNTGDFWELGTSINSGPPYCIIHTFDYKTPKTLYKGPVEYDVSKDGEYFAMKKITSDGLESAWSDEYFFKPEPEEVVEPDEGDNNGFFKRFKRPVAKPAKRSIIIRILRFFRWW